MRLNQRRTDGENPGHHRIEQLERLEGMTDKIFAGVVVLVIAVAAIAMIAT